MAPQVPTDDDGRERSGATAPAAPGRVIRVVLADDSYLVREAIAHVLDADPASSSSRPVDDGDALLAAVETERPDVVLTDIRMPPSGDDEGIVVANRLRDTHPDIGVVVVSQYADPRYGLALLERRLRRPRLPAQGAPARPRAADRGRLRGRARRLGGRREGRRGADRRARARASTRRSRELTPRELEILGRDRAGQEQPGDRRGARPHQARGREAHQRDLHEARPARTRRTSAAA